MQQNPPGASPPVNLKEYPQSLSDAPGAQVSVNKPTLIIVAFWRRELVLIGETLAFIASSFFLLPSSFFLFFTLSEAEGPSSFFLLPSSFFLLPSSFFLLPSFSFRYQKL